jgi:hypothetical protein
VRARNKNQWKFGSSDLLCEILSVIELVQRVKRVVPRIAHLGGLSHWGGPADGRTDEGPGKETVSTHDFKQSS